MTDLFNVRAANPNSPACDLRLIDLTLSEVVFTKEGPVHLAFSGGKGYMNVDGAGMVKVDPVTHFIIDIPLDASKGQEGEFEADVKDMRERLEKWRDNKTVLRLYGEPDCWTYVRGEDGEALVLPRSV